MNFQIFSNLFYVRSNRSLYHKYIIALLSKTQIMTHDSKFQQ